MRNCQDTLDRRKGGDNGAEGIQEMKKLFSPPSLMGHAIVINLIVNLRPTSVLTHRS
jgi:hypothetical protein